MRINNIFTKLRNTYIFLIFYSVLFFYSVHPVYPYSKSLGTHTRLEIPTARVRRKKPYVHWTLILNVHHHWQERGSKNVRDLRERAVLLFNGKNRRKREGRRRAGRRMWERFHDYRDSMDQPMELLPRADIGVARFFVFFFAAHFARVPFYTSERFTQWTNTFISFMPAKWFFNVNDTREGTCQFVVAF